MKSNQEKPDNITASLFMSLYMQENMMFNAVEFIQKNYTGISVLKDDTNGKVELVLGMDNNTYIRKTIPCTGLPYKKLQQIKQLSLPQIYHIAEDENNGITYVIEEHINGSNLQELLDYGTNFSEQEVKDIALQICDALRILHSHHILHRDIKPSNIIRRDDGIIKLIDFGAAKIMTPDTQRDTRVIGTPGFAPPEQYGFSATDVRSDFYALGKTLEELLDDKYKGYLRKVIKKCSEFDPQKRISSARKLKDLLLNGQAKRRKKYTAIVIIAIVIAGILFYIFRQDTATQLEYIEQNIPLLPTQQKDSTKSSSKPKSESKTGIKLPANQQQPIQDTSPNNDTDINSKDSSVLTTSDGRVPDNSVTLTTQNWNNFSVVKNLDDGEIVDFNDFKAPIMVVKNTSDVPLNNPKLEIYLHNFAVSGGLHTVESWEGRVEQITLSDEDSKGRAQKITIQLIGTVPPRYYYQFSLWGRVDNFYKLGNSPSVDMVLTSDNGEKLTTRSGIFIR